MATSDRSARALQASSWLALGLLGLAYTILRLSMNDEYDHATWMQLLDFGAVLPFGHRVLVPLLAQPLYQMGFSPAFCFGVFELASFLGLVVVLRRVLALYVSDRAAWTLAVGFTFLLPFSYLLRYKWPIYYPYDTPALLCVALGYYAVLGERWRLAVAVTTIGALNRETAAIVPLLVLAIHIERRPLRELLPWVGLMLAGWFAARVAIALALPDNLGPSLHLAVEGDYRVLNNLAWMADPSNLPILFANLAFLPLLWLRFSKIVPRELRLVRVLVWALFLAFMLVANLYEPRGLGELVVLLYVPVAVALYEWIWDAEQTRLPGTGYEPPAAVLRWVTLFDVWGIRLMLFAFAIFVIFLNEFHFLPLAQWPPVEEGP